MNLKQMFIELLKKIEAFDLKDTLQEGYHNSHILHGLVLIELSKFDYIESETDAKSQNTNLSRAKQSFKKGLSLQPENINSKLVCAGSLLDLALLQKTSQIGIRLLLIMIESSLISETLDTVLEFTENSESIFLLQIRGTCLFHQASIESHLAKPKLSLALDKVFKAIECIKAVLDGAETKKASDYQLVFQYFNPSWDKLGY